MNSIQELCDIMQLGKLVTNPQQVSGGFLHRIWCIQTSLGKYAIKELNSSIVTNDVIRNTYERTEQVARRLKEQGIPAATSLQHDNRSIIPLRNRDYIVYPWIEGHSLNKGIVSEVHAKQIAVILANIHHLRLVLPGLDQPEWSIHTNDEFNDLKEMSREAGQPYADDLTALLPSIVIWNGKFQKAVESLNKNLVISHRDLDQKNVLWSDDLTPIIIDWEASRAGNPTMEIITAALDWSGIGARQLNFEVFEAMIATYLKSGGKITDNSLDALYGVVGNCLNWLAHNIRQSHRETDSATRNIAVDEVHQTLLMLNYMTSLIPLCHQKIQTILGQ